MAFFGSEPESLPLSCLHTGLNDFYLAFSPEKSIRGLGNINTLAPSCRLLLRNARHWNSPGDAEKNVKSTNLPREVAQLQRQPALQTRVRRRPGC